MDEPPYDLNTAPPDAGPVVRLVNLIITEALNSESPQIRMRDARIEFLRDDEWIQVMRLPDAAYGPLVNRIRVMATLDRVAGNERQEGTFKAVFEDRIITITAAVQFADDGSEDVHMQLPISGGK